MVEEDIDLVACSVLREPLCYLGSDRMAFGPPGKCLLQRENNKSGGAEKYFHDLSLSE
jgi:hypothetical protein